MRDSSGFLSFFFIGWILVSVISELIPNLLKESTDLIRKLKAKSGLELVWNHGN